MKLNAGMGPAELWTGVVAFPGFDLCAEQFSLMKIEERGGAAWVGALRNHFCLPWAEKVSLNAFILLPLEKMQSNSATEDVENSGG